MSKMKSIKISEGDRVVIVDPDSAHLNRVGVVRSIDIDMCDVVYLVKFNKDEVC